MPGNAFNSLQQLFSEPFNYADGALQTVSGGRWASNTGGINVVSQAAIPTSNADYRASDSLSFFDPTKPYVMQAVLSVGSGGASGFAFESGAGGFISLEVNAQVNPAISRVFNGAGGNSGNFSVGSATGTFIMAMSIDKNRLANVSLNGSPLFTYQLNASTGAKQAAILFTFNVAGGNSIDNVKLSQ